MKKRTFWIDKIEASWKHRSIVWLAGVRRVGKTCLCQSLKNIEYFDCELPRIRRLLEDPEDFFSGLGKKRIVLDEIHRLGNPAETLKIGADHFPEVKILATGSSVLGAAHRFRDTLAGRKTDLWLTPMISDDGRNFGNTAISHRFLLGGLPPFFLEKNAFPEKDYQEWLDSYWARDIQDLFRLEKKYSFQKFFELLLLQSGGIFEATKFAKPCEVSRTTISNYLAVLEATYVAHVIRPFSSNKANEISSQPKVYGFDTGFVAYLKGWETLRSEDLGRCWEHYVLNELQAKLQTRNIFYWRDKRGHEVDFVLQRRGKPPIAIECKWKAGDIDFGNLKSFLYQYPDAESFILCSDVDRSFTRACGEQTVTFMNLNQFLAHFQKPGFQG